MLTQQSALRYFFAIFPSVAVVKSSPQNENRLSIFDSARHKSVTIATSLKRAVAIRICYYEANLTLDIS